MSHYFTTDERFRALPDKCLGCKQKNPFCFICAQSDNKERRSVQTKKTHCSNCCKWCIHCNKIGHKSRDCYSQLQCTACGKNGHSAYRPDTGEIWCFRLVYCFNCERYGHNQDQCRSHTESDEILHNDAAPVDTH